MTCLAKIYWPDCLEIFAANNFETLGSIVGAHIETEMSLRIYQPVKVEFSIQNEAA